MSRAKRTPTELARRRRVAFGANEAKQARANALEVQARRAATLGRTLPVARDPELARTEVSTRLVRQISSMIDADPTLCDWVEGVIRASYKRPGRPRQIDIRTALILFALQCVLHRNFHLIGLEATLNSLSWRTRRNLGIDYVRNGEVEQLSYNQLLDVFHSMADAFDAWDERLVGDPDEDAVRAQRAADLQLLVERLTAASTAPAPRAAGEVAVDATMKWAWERPPGSAGKIGRRGNDGDAGAPARLADVMDGEEPQDPAPDQVVKRIRRTTRKASWPSTWSLGSEWAGRANKKKAVFGYALHSVVRSGPEEPALIETFTLTPAVAHPAKSLMPVLQRFHAVRASDPTLPAAADALGRVSADPGYSYAKKDDWQLPLLEIGASPIYRLHRYQEPASFRTVGIGKRAGDVLFFHGRPMCECAANHPSTHARYPQWPHTAKRLGKYQREIAQLVPFEWAPNGAAKPNGSRQFLAPHKGGGCERCVQGDGSAVEVDGQPVVRCCQTPSRVFSRRDLYLMQEERFGSPEWASLWNRRNVVEGSYGVMKNRSVLDWGHDFHRFVGLARETLVAAFAVVAYNFHMLRSWRAKQRMHEPDDTEDAFDPFNPSRLVGTTPAPNQIGVAHRAGAAARTVRGPKGLEFLGGDPPTTAG